MNQLEIRVTPRSSRNKVEITPDGNVKVFVTAPPADGEANDAVLKVLAKALSVAPTSLSVIRGQKSREKVIDLGNLSKNEAYERLKRVSQ
jgi:uncharacterized protein (TIGR00251 family)